MNDVVLTPHVNPYTCGTGKWSGELARQLGVPLRTLALAWAGRSPLVSARLSEIPMLCPPTGLYDLIVHDWDMAKIRWVHGARHLWAVRPDLVRFCAKNGRPDTSCLPCPSSVRGNPEAPGLRVVLFGMAHKRQQKWLVRLRTLLEQQGDYTVLVSTAVHEGSPFDGAMLDAETALREVFGDHLRMLGFLADDGLARELRRAHLCAVFFEPAARANNTTLWAALDAGCTVVTNLDEDSPRELVGAVINLADAPSLQVPGRVADTPRWSAVVEILRAA